MRRLLVLLLLLLSACNTGYGTQPNQAEATRVVWVQTYGVTGHPPPAVQWIEGPQLDCYDNMGWYEAGAGDGGAPLCVAGLFFNNDWFAQVAWPAGNETFSTTAFAHELCHAFSWLQSGGTNADPTHIGPCFQPNGGYVQVANEALEAEGL